MNESFDPNSLVIAVHEHCLFLFLHRAGRCMVSMQRSGLHVFNICSFVASRYSVSPGGASESDRSRVNLFRIFSVLWPVPPSLFEQQWRMRPSTITHARQRVERFLESLESNVPTDCVKCNSFSVEVTVCHTVSLCNYIYPTTEDLYQTHLSKSQNLYHIYDKPLVYETRVPCSVDDKIFHFSIRVCLPVI